MNNTKTLIMLTVAATISIATPSRAEIPEGYYASAYNLGGKELLQELHDIIDDHHDVGYKGLWLVYSTSDIREDGSIWDMYSTKHWTWSADQCGNYSKVGDCYNREHSMPKSWFNEGSPMVSDAFHIYPTDGKVNGQRSNYPYGECASGTTLPSNGGVNALGKLGKSTFPGYSGTVFEPVDEYKGDFARTYFYMATRYNDKISSWKSDMLANNSFPVFTQWALNLLLKWDAEDPVSEKEIKRNDAVYIYQGNRNPYIDHPELTSLIWGDRFGDGWTPTQADIENVETATSVTITPTEGGVTITAGTEWIPLTIHSADGICWFSGKVAETEHFDLESGIYIVKATGKAHRILIK